MARVARDRIVAGNRKRTSHSAARLGLAAIIAALILTSAAAAHSTMIAVDALTDGSVALHCTLRDAITAANTMSAMNNCAGGTGSDTIVFNVTGAISLVSTLPTVTDANLTITGPPSPGIKIDGGGLVQLMQVDAGATLTLQFLTMANGLLTGASGGDGDGGAILNQGTLTVTSTTFSANRATGGADGGKGDGGAIINQGTLTVTNSTFSANVAQGGAGGGAGVGGAIFNRNRGTLTVTNSTFSANVATAGLNGGPAVGGAIFNDGTLTATNSTFSTNKALSIAPAGGAIFNGGTASLKGTILAASSPDDCGPFGVTDAGYNISDDNSCGFSAITSKSNTVPKLAAGLASNGGPTRTIALQLGSPAIDAIPFASCTDASGNQLSTDQRGMPRPNPLDGANGPCDIGAYEVQVEFFNVPPLEAANCHGKIVSALAQRFGGLDAATSALAFPSVNALQTDIRAFCGD